MPDARLDRLPGVLRLLKACVVLLTAWLLIGLQPIDRPAPTAGHDDAPADCQVDFLLETNLHFIHPADAQQRGALFAEPFVALIDLFHVSSAFSSLPFH